MARVVVTGMGIISPAGNEVKTFWENVKAGRSAIAPITRFKTERGRAMLAAEIKKFEPLLYMDHETMIRTDSFTQYALAAVQQAMEDSGLCAAEEEEKKEMLGSRYLSHRSNEINIDPARLGVYFGSGLGGQLTIEQQIKDWYKKEFVRVSPMYISMAAANVATGNISIRYNAQGQCLPIAAGGCTGAIAIGEAARAIRHGYADAIIAGASEAAITDLVVDAFSSSMSYSTASEPELSMLPFDRRRNGIVVGEGAGALVLEEYTHAKARGAKIYAEVAGYGSACDAYHITAPHSEAVGATTAIVQAICDALKITDRDYIEKIKQMKIYINGNGLAMKLTDRAEALAYKKAFGSAAQGIPVSSIKPVIGHMLGAAGAVESIATIMALKEGVMPPTAFFSERDPECDVDCIPGKMRYERADMALSLNFGYGGHNSCLAFTKAEPRTYSVPSKGSWR